MNESEYIWDFMFEYTLEQQFSFIERGFNELGIPFKLSDIKYIRNLVNDNLYKEKLLSLVNKPAIELIKEIISQPIEWIFITKHEIITVYKYKIFGFRMFNRLNYNGNWILFLIEGYRQGYKHYYNKLIKEIKNIRFSEYYQDTRTVSEYTNYMNRIIKLGIIDDIKIELDNGYGILL